MIPTYFLELQDTPTSPKEYYKVYFDKQYPEATDCKILDTQIKSIKEDIKAIQKRITDRYVECNCFAASLFHTSGFVTRSKSLKYLNSELLVKKENIFKMSNCENILKSPIETPKDSAVNPLENTGETATNLNSNQSLINNLDPKKMSKKTLLFIGLGFVVVASSVFLYFKNKK